MACGANPSECGRGSTFKDYIRNDAEPNEESSILVFHFCLSFMMYFIGQNPCRR